MGIVIAIKDGKIFDEDNEIIDYHSISLEERTGIQIDIQLPYIGIAIPEGIPHEINEGEKETAIIIDLSEDHSESHNYHIFHFSGSNTIRETSLVEKYKFYLSILNKTPDPEILNDLFRIDDQEQFFKNWIELITGDETIDNFMIGENNSDILICYNL